MDPPVRIRGITEPLPPGERLLWEGSPAPGGLARDWLRVRWVFGYFVLLSIFPLLLQGGGTDASPARAIGGAAWLLLLGALAAGMLIGVARFAARTTTYAITDRRLVLRIGMAFPSVVNIPFSKVGGAGIRVRPDGTADLALELRATDPVSWFLLWPHARPWHLRIPQPMLRSVPEGERVGAILREAIRAAGVSGAEREGTTPVAWDMLGLLDDPTESPPGLTAGSSARYAPPLTASAGA